MLRITIKAVVAAIERAGSAIGDVRENRIGRAEGNCAAAPHKLSSLVERAMDQLGTHRAREIADVYEVLNTRHDRIVNRNSDAGAATGSAPAPGEVDASDTLVKLCVGQRFLWFAVRG